jgi:hypothetical protein
MLHEQLQSLDEALKNDRKQMRQKMRVGDHSEQIGITLFEQGLLCPQELTLPAIVYCHDGTELTCKYNRLEGDGVEIVQCFHVSQCL